jgi:phosphoglycerate dehydrogenase-like enzyme
MIPHLSGWTERMLDARAALIAINVERTGAGELPINAMNTET